MLNVKFLNGKACAGLTNHLNHLDHLDHAISDQSAISQGFCD